MSITEPGLELVAHNPLFQGVSSDAVEDVLKVSTLTNFKPGAILVEKGSKPDSLILLCQGTIGVYNENVLLANIDQPAVLGESILADTTATATLKASTDILICSVQKSDFITLSQKNPQLILNLFKLNLDRLKQSNERALEESRKREAELERQVEERTRELNDALDHLTSTNKELVMTRDQLIETEKFRQQFLANMSHEIRTPMNAIVGLTNLLLKSQLNELQEKYLGVIQKSGSNLLVIINDILDLAKIEAGKMELEETNFDVHSALQNVQTILGLKADEKGIRMNLEIAPELPQYMIGDETRLTQVVMNLTGNAIKFTEKGGVTISVKPNNDGTFRFSVKDTGIGIPKDRLEKVFESFGQASKDTTRKYGGTGLGLTISRQLVELHGGQLKLASEFGKGSDFYFDIKINKGEAPLNTFDGITIDVEKLAALKVLLVEDNEFNQMVAVDTLQDLFPGLKVDVAESGEEAIEKLKAADYSFVFMDIQMPGMNGYETTQQIRSQLTGNMKKVRVCAMTANVTKEEIQQCYDSGMDDYMMKPYSPDQLKEKVILNGIA